ncbi:hypothetical protein NNRS527_02434 [Nitrosospira sp. NRS527]|nr:hypothetical protein NNRS527_02434 [Nitrosospira sp. NRS527]
MNEYIENIPRKPPSSLSDLKEIGCKASGWFIFRCFFGQ